MSKQTSVNLDVTINPVGFVLSGGQSGGVNSLEITGGNIELVGSSASETYTFPSASTTLVGADIPNTFTALQRFSAGLSAAGGTFSGNISAPNITNTSKVISVKDYGVFGNGVSDDSEGISAAFTAAMGVTGILYFPPGIYILANTGPNQFPWTTQIRKTLTGPLKIIGQNATIKCNPNENQYVGQMLYIVNPSGYDLEIDGIVFDANRKSHSCVRIDSDLTSVRDCSIDINNCAFTNAYWLYNDIRNSSGITLTPGSAGLYLIGSFKRVNITNTKVINISRGQTAGIAGSQGTVGIAIQGVTIGNAFWAPKSVNISGCYFDTVTNESVTGPNGQADYDGGNFDSDCDCLSVFYPRRPPIYGGINYAEQLTTITNNTFKNCKGRSIKLQNETTVVNSNTFYRNIRPIFANGFSEVNPQISSGIISNNIFLYEPENSNGISCSPFINNGSTAPNSAVVSFFNTSDTQNRSRNITIKDNHIFNNVPKSVGTLRTPFSVSSDGFIHNKPLYTTIKDNKVAGQGRCLSFAGVNTFNADQTDTSYLTVKDNTIDDISSPGPGYTAAFLISSSGENFNKNIFNIEGNIHGGDPVRHLITTSGSGYYQAKIHAMNNINIGLTFDFGSESFGNPRPLTRNLATSFIPRIPVIGDPDSSLGSVFSVQSANINHGVSHTFQPRGYFQTNNIHILTSNYDNSALFMFTQGSGSSNNITSIFRGTGITFSTNATDPNPTGITGFAAIWINNVGFPTGPNIIVRNNLSGSNQIFNLYTFGG